MSHRRPDLLGSQLGKAEHDPVYLALLAEECLPGPTYTAPEDGDTRRENATQTVSSGCQGKPVRSCREVTPQADSSGFTQMGLS